jgi:tetratricopeptide (TPR) repeat protein
MTTDARTAWHARDGRRPPETGARRVRLRILWGVVAVSVVLLPATAAAQGRHLFASAIVELSEALDGGSGDEGPRVEEALDALAGALVQWDHEVRVVETQVADGLPTAPPDLILPMHLGLALSYAERGRIADAVASVDRALAEVPDDPYAHLLRGLLLVDTRPVDARDALGRAWELDPGDAVKAFWVVQTAGEASARVSGASQALSAMYRQIREREPGAPGWPEPFLDRSLFRDGAAGVPVFSLVRYRPGFSRIAEGAYEEGIDALRAAAAADPLVTDPALRLEPAVRGSALLREERPLDAVAQFAAARDRAPESSEIHRLLGTAYRAAGRLEESVAALDAAIRLDATNERAYLELIGLLWDDGEVSSAARGLQVGLAALPESGILRWMLATIHRQAGNLPESLRQLQQLSTDGMLLGQGLVYAERGRLYREARMMAEALAELEARVRIDPNNPLAHAALGELRRTSGLGAPALASFVAALLMAPELADAHAGVGYVYLAAGLLDDAIDAFRHALDLRSDLVDARYGLASALERAGRREEAAAELDAVRRP